MRRVSKNRFTHILAIVMSLLSFNGLSEEVRSNSTLLNDAELSPPNCIFAEGMNDFFYDENFIYFHVKEGTLEKNIRRILELTYPNHSVRYEVNRHTVVSDTCIAARSPDGLIQRLIEGYEKPSTLIFATFPNNVAGIFYITSPKLSKYFRAG